MFSSGPDFFGGPSLFGQQDNSTMSYSTFPSQPFQPSSELYSAPTLGYAGAGAGGGGGTWPSVSGAGALGGMDPWSTHPEGDAACQSSLLAALHQARSYRGAPLPRGCLYICEEWKRRVSPAVPAQAI